MIVDQMVIDYVDYVRSGFVDDGVFDEFSPVIRRALDRTTHGRTSGAASVDPSQVGQATAGLASVEPACPVLDVRGEGLGGLERCEVAGGIKPVQLGIRQHPSELRAVRRRRELVVRAEEQE